MAEQTRAVGGGVSGPSGVLTRGHCPRIPATSSSNDSGMEDSPYTSLEVSITATEIKALRATNKELVPAPGAGKVLQLLGATIILDYGGTAYAEQGNDNFAINYTDASGAVASEVLEATGFIDATTDQIRHMVPAIVSPVMVANAALTLDQQGSGELITGNGVLRVKIMYAVHATGL